MGYSDWFMERIVMPEVSAVWSSDPAAVWDFPISFLAEFLKNHGQLELRGRPQWRTVVGGSRTYVNAIADELGDSLRLDARGAPGRAPSAAAGSWSRPRDARPSSSTRS